MGVGHLARQFGLRAGVLAVRRNDYPFVLVTNLKGNTPGTVRMMTSYVGTGVGNLTGSEIGVAGHFPYGIDVIADRPRVSLLGY